MVRDCHQGIHTEPHNVHMNGRHKEHKSNGSVTIRITPLLLLLQKCGRRVRASFACPHRGLFQQAHSPTFGSQANLSLGTVLDFIESRSSFTCETATTLAGIARKLDSPLQRNCCMRQIACRYAPNKIILQNFSSLTYAERQEMRCAVPQGKDGGTNIDDRIKRIERKNRRNNRRNNRIGRAYQRRTAS